MKTTAHALLPVQHEGLLRILAGVTFVIFFQAYMVAPILPALSQAFRVSESAIGQIVPAYLIPYGISTLIYGFIADTLGIHRVMLGSLTAFVLLTMLSSTATNIGQLELWRVATGLGAGGVVPLALVTVGRIFPYEQRGRPLGWLFGAMAGGMAFGAPSGALLMPLVGWRGLFFIVGVLGVFLLLALLSYLHFLASITQRQSLQLTTIVAGYRELFRMTRATRTYGYVLVNSIFHSGVFTWLAVFLEQRYQLDAVHVGLALLGYGVPGFLLGPIIGRIADRWGRARMIPLGLLLSAAAPAALLIGVPVKMVPLVALVLSLGYDMTQPLFGGIVTSLGSKRPGQAMGLNVFTLFVGFGIGSLLFGAIIPYGMTTALAAFASFELVAALCAFQVFRWEVPALDGNAVISDRTE